LTSESRFLALLDRLRICPQPLPLLFFDSLVDLDADNLRQSTIDLALAVSRKASIGVGDVVPEEEYIKEHGKQE
jgi:hypothetical protein